MSLVLVRMGLGVGFALRKGPDMSFVRVRVGVRFALAEVAAVTLVVLG